MPPSYGWRQDLMPVQPPTMTTIPSPHHTPPAFSHSLRYSGIIKIYFTLSSRLKIDSMETTKLLARVLHVTKFPSSTKDISLLMLCIPFLGSKFQKLQRIPAQDALLAELDADWRVGPDGRSALVPSPSRGSLPPRPAGLDVLFADLLDVVCTVWSIEQL